MAAGLGIGWGINWGSIALSAKAVLDYLTFKLNFNTIATDFTFIRNSFATRVNEFGLIETVTNLGSDLVQNGSFDELGSEQVVNGDFATDSDWTLVSNSTISDGKANAVSNANGFFIIQTSTLDINKTYKLTFDLTDYTSGDLQFATADGDISFSNTLGTKELTFNPLSANILFKCANSPTTLSIDNVSVKQVDPNDDWTKVNSTISDGKGNLDSTSSSSILFQQNVLTVGKTYKANFDVSNYNGLGTCALINSSGVTQFEITSDGNKDFYFTHGGSSANLTFRAVAGGIFSIDNVSVQEVLTDDVPRIDYTGSTFDVPVLSDELVRNGDFATDSNWSKQSGWSIANGVATFDINDYVSGNTNIYQNCMVSGKEYVLTFDIVDYVQGTIQVASMNGSPQWSGNGTKTIKFTSTNANLFMNASNSNNTILSIDNVSVKEVTAYTTTDKGAFLLEPISTNLIDYSEDIEGSNWTTSGIATTTDVTTSPDGTQNADLIDSVSNGSCFISDSTLTFTIGNTYTFSVFAKKGNNDWIRTAHVSSATNASWFDLENGVVGTVNGVSGTIEDFGNGWYKCTNTFVATQATGGNQVFIGICDANGSTDAGASGQNDYVWGMQVEELSYATSYIPTSSTTVTRAQESCIDATPTINSEEGVLYGELSVPAADTFVLIALGNSSANNDQNSVTIGFDNGVDFYGRVKSPSGSFVSQSVDAPINTNYKIALRYEQNNCALFVDGVKIASSSINYLFALPLDNLSFNYNTNNGLPFYGRTKDLRIYDKALTDDELIELTTI